jgi:outer membrane protein OmpA-like peptidoglycan-associated protein
MNPLCLFVHARFVARPCARVARESKPGTLWEGYKRGEHSERKRASATRRTAIPRGFAEVAWQSALKSCRFAYVLAKFRATGKPKRRPPMTMMKSFTSNKPRRASFAVALLISISLNAVLLAEEPTPKKEIQKRELELKEKRLELEKKELDLQRREAALEAAKKDLAMQESAGAITMNLEGDVLFDFDKSELRPEARDALGKVAAVIAAFPESNVLIEGHTDSKGSPKANLALSKKRAESVKNWLVKEKGLSADNITTEGLGESKPVAENKNADGTDNPEGRQKNRRVTITVQKTKAP